MTVITMMNQAWYQSSATTAMASQKWKCGMVWSMDQDAVIVGKHHDQ
jgi:hypothetical protein